MTRLKRLDGAALVTRGWPRKAEQLPCIAVTRAADTPVSFRDDREHIAQLEYYIRVFALRAQQADDLAQRADEAMQDMGYVRTLAYDSDDQDVRIAALRYRKYV